MNPNKAPANGIVVLGYGPQDMDFIDKAAKLAGVSDKTLEGALDNDVARMAGANFAIGGREALADLRARLEAGAKLYIEEEMRGLSLPAGAAEWLASGERGSSSNTMFSVLTGVVACRDGYYSYPLDPSDLRRCRLLLDAVPALKLVLQDMRHTSSEWAGLIDAWQEICTTMNEEAPDWATAEGWSCPRTYALIKKAIER